MTEAKQKNKDNREMKPARDEHCIYRRSLPNSFLHPLILAFVLLILLPLNASVVYGEDLSNDGKNNSSVGDSSKMQDTEEEATNLSLDDSKILFDPLTRFSGALFSQVRSEKNNVILSPLSVHAALNLVQLGAEPGTKTDNEIRSSLAYPENSNDNFHAAYKNVIRKFQAVSRMAMRQQQQQQQKQEVVYGRGGKQLPIVDFYNTIITKQSKPLLSDYAKQTQDYYNSSVEPISLEKPETISTVLDKINKWGKDAGFEEKILNGDEFKGDFTTMLLSAVRVQAYWFSAMHELPRKTVFYNFGLKDKPVQVEQLSDHYVRAKLVEFTTDSKVEFRVAYDGVKNLPEMKDLAKLNARVLELPLVGKVNFVLIEPKDNGTGGELTNLVQNLLRSNNNKPADKLVKLLKVIDESESVHLNFLTMPKFTFENNIDLVEPLKALGINQAFETSTSELRRIVLDERVYIDAVKHQAMIDVNKDGIKAAAVTKIILLQMSALLSREPINIRIQNPFMFIIRYEKMPLFIGQLVELKQ